MGGNGPSATNATIAQIGPIAQTLDPVIQENTVFSHQTAPQADTVQSILPVLISNTRNSSFTYQQGFLIGGNVTVAYRDSYLNENAPTDVLNPSSAPSLTLHVPAESAARLRGRGERPHHSSKPIECQGFRAELQDPGEQYR